MRAALATDADGPAPVESGTLEERVAASFGLFPGLQLPMATDDDFSRPVEKRQQRHKSMAFAGVDLIVKNAVLPIAQSVPFPAADGGLAHGTFFAGERRKRTPTERVAHTAEALRSVQLHFDDSAAYFPMDRPENRAGTEKKPSSDHCEPPEMAKAAIHFYVIGTAVGVQPEVRTAADNNQVYDRTRPDKTCAMIFAHTTLTEHITPCLDYETKLTSSFRLRTEWYVRPREVSPCTYVYVPGLFYSYS